MTTVLLLESARANGASFAPHLARRYNLLLAHTGQQAVELTRCHQVDVLVIDAVSMRSSGDRLCQMLRSEIGDLPIIHVKDGPPAEQSSSSANALLYMPLTYRKICNRIEYFMQQETGEIIMAGKFELNVQQELLTTPQGEIHKLTPKLTHLLAILMQNTGQVVERRTLMQEVWQTDYMGDTRTLDVHIRWMRQVIEANPGKPRHIQTVRGRGYRFHPE